MDRACCRRRLVSSVSTEFLERGDAGSHRSEVGQRVPMAKRPRSAPLCHRAPLLSSSAEPCPANGPSSSAGSTTVNDADGAMPISAAGNCNSSSSVFVPPLRGAASNGFGGPIDGTAGEQLFDGFRRREVVQLLQHTLLDLGLGAAQAALQQESGIPTAPDRVAGLHQAIVGADWDGVLEGLQLLGVDGALRNSLRFLVLEQKFLERVAHANETDAALACWRDEWSPAAFDADTRERVQRSHDYLACKTLEELEHATNWRLEGSREALWERVISLLPPTMAAVPARRLSVLLWQAVRYQQLHCPYHHVDPSHARAPVSLLRDYTCEPTPLPTHCIACLRHSDEVWFAAASQDGRFIASASKDRSVIVWECNPPSHFKVSHVLHGHLKPCTHLAWSWDDQYLLSASNDGTVRLWGSDKRSEPVHVFRKHNEPVTSVAWLRDSKRFLSAGYDKCVFLWSIDGSVLHRWEIPSRVQDLGITYDGSRALVVNSDHNLKVIDLTARNEIFALPESGAVTSICVSQLRDEVLVNIAHQVISTQQRPVIRLWDLVARSVSQQYFGHFQGRFVVSSCFGGSREEFVVSGSEDAQVYIWHKHYGSLLQMLPGHGSVVNSVSWSNVASGPWLISTADDYTLRIWSATTAEFYDVDQDNVEGGAVAHDASWDGRPEGASDEEVEHEDDLEEEGEEEGFEEGSEAVSTEAINSEGHASAGAGDVDAPQDVGGEEDAV